MKTLKITALALLIIAVSCKKEEPATSVSKSELISKGPWTIVSIEYDFDGNGTIDRNRALFSCELDDFSKFLSNGSYVLDPGL